MSAAFVINFARATSKLKEAKATNSGVTLDDGEAKAVCDALQTLAQGARQ